MGRKEDARKIFVNLKERMNPYYEAEVHLILGEKEEAFVSLEKAYSERSFYMVFLKVDPCWDSIRSDPRFQALCDSMNFPK